MIKNENDLDKALNQLEFLEKVKRYFLESINDPFTDFRRLYLETREYIIRRKNER